MYERMIYFIEQFISYIYYLELGISNGYINYIVINDTSGPTYVYV